MNEQTACDSENTLLPVAENKEGAGKRLGYIDVMRGIAALLVVLGHCAPPVLDTYIFTFHMPLFFFVSGVTFALKEKQPPFFVFVKKKFLRLIVPYVCFEAINLILSLITSIFYDGVTVTFPDAILSILTGFSSYGAGYSGVVGRLGFFPCLFFAYIAFYFIHAAVQLILKKLKAQRAAWQAAAYALVAIILYAFSYIINKYTSQWWLYTDVAIMGCVFISLGCAAKDLLSAFINAKLYIRIPVAFISLAGLIFFSYLNYNVFSNHVDVFMFARLYGNFKTFIFAAVCGIIFCAALSSFIVKWEWLSRVLGWFGRNSLVVYVAHMWFLFLFSTLIFSPLSESLVEEMGVWWTYLSPWAEFVILIACTAPTVKFINTFCPFLLGEKFKKREDRA